MPKLILKPCPFCGGKAELYKSSFDYGSKNIECSECHIVTRDGRKYDVITIWNRRAEVIAESKKEIK